MARYGSGYLLLGLLFSLGLSAIMLVPGPLVQAYYDDLTHNPSRYNIPTLMVILLALPLSGGLIGFSKMISDVQSGTRITSLLRINLFNEFMRFPFGWHRRGSGYAINLLRDDTGAVCGFLFTVIDTLVKLLTVFFAVRILISVNERLTLFVFFPLVLVILIAQSTGQVVLSRSRKSRKASTDLMIGLAEVFATVQAIQVAGAFRHVIDRFDALNRTRRSAMLNEKLSRSVIGALYSSTNSMGIGLIMILAAWSLSTKAITVGELELFSMYLGIVLGSCSVIGNTISEYKRIQVSIERMSEWSPDGRSTEAKLFVHRPVYLEGPLPAIIPPTRHGQPLEVLEVRNLSYTHADSSTGISDINLRLRRGSVTVITGGMGSGKTTLLLVLLGLLPLRSGSILWNGEEVADPAEFMRPGRCAYTPQNPNLFSGSLVDNVLLGVPKDDRQLSESLRMAVLERDIAATDEGLETRIGPRGAGLSGGQRQRLALARMFMRDADLMVLDDPSSALDAETESELWRMILESKDKRTYLIACNRREIVERADTVVVLEEGRISAQGKFTELLRESEFLQQLVAPKSLS